MMARVDLIRSIVKGYHIMGHVVTEKDLSSDYRELVRVNRGVWSQVRMKNARSRKQCHSGL